ncbi:MAG TPA: hypothetical protein VFX16_33985 [Pseudonocardiaceae bacterium]|nr:hypothetical protein [Pseudonocardiaceae bacterium]
MTQLPVHSVTVSREDDRWVAAVHDIPTGTTDVERFEELPAAVRDLIATLLVVEPDSFWIDWHYRMGQHDLTSAIGHLREWEDMADRAARNRDGSRRAAVAAMRSAGLSYREIAEVIGMSHQRVGQLLAEPDQVVDIQFPTGISVVPEKWRQSDAGQPTPFESALIELLHSALRTRPDSRHSLLSTSAATLADAADDPEFLYSR